MDDDEEEQFLRSVAAKVGEHGGNFERVIRAKERDNPKFDFFHDESVRTSRHARFEWD